MELGLSSLGYINDRKINKKYNLKIDLLMDASEACLEFCEKNDVKVCEILFDPPDITSLENILKFVDMCSNFSIKQQIHGPYIDTNLASHNPWSANAAIETYIQVAKICKGIGAQIYTIHPGSSKFMFNENKVFVIDQLISSTTALLEAISDLKIITCIENMQKKTGILLDLNEITNFFTKINRNDLFFTWDTSHSWTCDVNVKDLWEKCHSIIKNIHVVDNTVKTSDVHPCLGTGVIDFKEIFDIVNSYNYNGSLIIELGSGNDSLKSIEYIRKFL